MGLTLFIYAEQRTSDGWRLSLGLMLNPEWDATTWDRSRYIPRDVFSSTDKALRAILGYSRRRFCSTTDFESPQVVTGIPRDADSDLRQWLQFQCANDIEVWTVMLEDLKAFPFATKTIVRAAYVPKAAAPLFFPSCPFPHEQWPEGVPMGYAAASSHGVLVEWTETYAEAAGTDFFDALKELEGIESEVRLVCMVG